MNKISKVYSAIEDIKHNFLEVKPDLTFKEVIEEANRCLYCYDAPCIKACPTSIDIPSFIKKITTDNLKGSARVILRLIQLEQLVQECVQLKNYVKGHVY